jgi:hypothetical protein
VRCAIRDASPFSFFGTSSSHDVSLARRRWRATLIPQVCVSAGLNRSCEKGIRSSADHPCASIDTAEDHTASHEVFSKVSFEMTRSRCTPAALTMNATPVR